MKLSKVIARNVKRFFKKLLCRHWFKYDLIFGGQPNTHNDVKTCIKCGKSIVIFSGTRSQWIGHHKIEL